MLICLCDLAIFNDFKIHICQCLCPLIQVPVKTKEAPIGEWARQLWATWLGCQIWTPVFWKSSVGFEAPSNFKSRTISPAPFVLCLETVDSVSTTEEWESLFIKCPVSFQDLIRLIWTNRQMNNLSAVWSSTFSLTLYWFSEGLRQ